MNVKQKLRKFFTLTRTADGGFTLVELIVVIAILAILAGVAVPAYNGYINYAGQAADEQLMAAVNSAFGAACLEYGMDSIDISDAIVKVENSTVQGLAYVEHKTLPIDSTTMDGIKAAFLLYMEGNQNDTFRSDGINALTWQDDHFEIMSILLSNGYLSLDADVLAAIRASGFAEMGVLGVTNALQNMNSAGGTLATLVANVGAFDRLSAALIANGYMDQAEADKLADDLSIINKYKNPDAYKAAQESAANGLQMCVAEYVANASDSEIQKLMEIDLGSSSAIGMVSAMTTHGGTIGSSALAMQYGIANSFASSDYSSSATISVRDGWSTKNVSVNEYLANYADDPVAAIDKIQNLPEYQEYVSSQQYQSDVNGLAGTLSVVGSNIESGTINTDTYLEQGVQGTEVQSVLGAILGG